MIPTRIEDTRMPRTMLLLAIASILPAAAGADTEQAFSALAGITGADSTCIAVYDMHDGRYLVHGPEQCEERLSPCSTFKVPNALIGLETGVLGGPNDRKAWDGTRHSREVNNQDHDLASAIRHSVVWYFQDVALDIGPQRMQAWLDAFESGNRDISGGQYRFWLSSSLEISAAEQLRFMAALDAEKYLDALEQSGLSDNTLVVYAKTGPVDGRRDVTAFLVEKGFAGFSTAQKLDKLGMRGSNTCELIFEDCRVPMDNLIGEEGQGFNYLMDKLQQERLVCAIWAVAGAERILEWTMAHCRETQISGKPVSKSQAVQFGLIEMVTDFNHSLCTLDLAFALFFENM